MDDGSARVAFGGGLGLGGGLGRELGGSGRTMSEREGSGRGVSTTFGRR